MTTGEGVTHSEEATGRYRGQLHGVQLWMAQPDTWARAATRWCCRRPAQLLLLGGEPFGEPILL